VYTRACEAIECVLSEGVAAAMNGYNQPVQSQ
jgi:hypothetical protein